MESMKNSMLSLAATDLGLGADLKAQLTDEEERKKRKQEMQNNPANFGDAMQPIGMAAMMLGLGPVSK